MRTYTADEVDAMIGRALARERERVAQQQEPVAIALNTGTKQGIKWLKNVEHGEPLYTSPPAQRKPLTDEEIEEMANDFEEGYVFLYRSFARAIEAKLREKNT